MAKKMWFTMKHHGWGWVPISWEGWALTIGIVWFIIDAGMKYEAGTLAPQLFSYRLLIGAGILIAAGYLKGPKPKWRWDKI